MLVTEVKRRRGRPRGDLAAAEQKTNQSLERALMLLKEISRHDGLTLTELSGTLDMPPSTAHRLLSTLEAHGLVEMSQLDQGWSVGLEALRVGMAYQRRNKLVAKGRPFMHGLMEQTGETVNLAVFDKGEVVFLSQVECAHPLRAFFPTGERRPAHSSGIGKAILAEKDPIALHAILAQMPLRRFTEHTITDRDALTAALTEGKARGWSVDDEEANIGMRCVAAPVFNEYGEAVAGISLSGPSARLTKERVTKLGAQVREVADEITNVIGGVKP